MVLCVAYAIIIYTLNLSIFGSDIKVWSPGLRNKIFVGPIPIISPSFV